MMLLAISPLLIAAALWWWLESDTRPPVVTRSAAMGHLRQMHQGIGLLENAVRTSEFETANAIFAELANAHPDQLMPLRNLVIGRYLAIRATRDAMENSTLPTVNLWQQMQVYEHFSDAAKNPKNAPNKRLMIGM